VSRVFNFVLKTDSGSPEKPGEVTVRGMSVGHGVRVVLLAVPKKFATIQMSKPGLTQPGPIPWYCCFIQIAKTQVLFRRKIPHVFGSS